MYLRRCWVSSFGGIFSPGAISGNLHPSAVRRRMDFLSSPLGETLLVWLPAVLDYCGLSLASWWDYLSGLLTRYLLPVWVIKCPAPLFFRHAYPCLGKHETSEARLLFEEVENLIVWVKDGTLTSVFL